jgi:hypothetical protein
MSNDTLLDSACSEIGAWIRAPHRDAGFQRDKPPESWRDSADEIVSTFLNWVGRSGFALQLVNHGTESAPAWVGHWTYNGNEFEGFRQPPNETDPNAARLLACAALLKNHWCCARIR